MEVIRFSSVLNGENSCHPREKPVVELMDDAKSKYAKQDKPILIEDEKADNLQPNTKVVMETIQSDVREMAGNGPILEGSSNDSPYSADVNGLKSGGLVDHEENLEDHIQSKEACLDFQNSHVDVDTIEGEPLCDNNEEELSVSAFKIPEHDESLALWVKWRGRWQAGIKCERADWPLATVKAKPTHERKSYIVIFFPHTRNYSWADTLLVCTIDEFPQPIAHRSHKIGVQLVEDLTVARRFIMKKLIIGVLNIVDQLPIQVLTETARDVVVWRDFTSEASRCKGYLDLGRLLIKLQNMILKQYVDADWLQHSFHLWLQKCQNALTADTIELLKEELMDSILWNELDSLRDEGQPALGSEWKIWKHEVLKCFTTTPPLSGAGEQLGNYSTEHLTGGTPLIMSPQFSRKRPKLEVRRADTHYSLMEDKSSQKDTVVEIDSSFFAARHDMTADNIALSYKEEHVSQETAQITSLGNSADIWNVVVDTSNAAFVQNKDGQLQTVDGVVDTISSTFKTRSQQCIAYVESKGRRCVRWANEGEEYCCVHVVPRFVTKSVETEITSPVETMCHGTTNFGSRCKHRSLPASSFCKKHRLHSDGVKSPSSPGSHLKRKHDELLDKSEFTSSKDIIIVEKPQQYIEDHSLTLPLLEGSNLSGGNSSLCMPTNITDESDLKHTDMAYCIGLGLHEGVDYCLDTPKRHSLYCEKHIPNWLKRARNGKDRIISKEVFLDLLRTCPSQKQKVYLHQACELFYKLFKSILSLRNPVPKEIQFQWVLSEASKDLHTVELLMKLVSREKERLHRMWGFELNKDEQVSFSHVQDLALVPIAEEIDHDGSFKCTICSENFSDDQTLGTHWIDSHNKEAQWLFRGYACAICLDSFTNKKVLETHVQERHHAQFVEHCMLIQCIPCGSHFGNSEELWSHVLSVHTERFRQPKTGDDHFSAPPLQKSIPLKPPSIENNSGIHSNVRKFVCRFCGLKFDLLPDLGRHHQAAHMAPSSFGSRPKKKGLRFYTYRLKSGRLSRPRLKKVLGGASYRLRNKGSILLKKRLHSATSLGPGGINMQSHVIGAASLVRLTEPQCSAIAKLLSSEAKKTKARPSNHEILSIARSACCKFGLHRSLEHKYGALPERLYLKAAKLCSEHNIQVNWHQEDFNCSRGCKPVEDQDLVAVLTCPTNEHRKMDLPPSNSQLATCEIDECHYVIESRHFRWKHLQTQIILCDDISFGQEKVPVPCVVDKHLIDSLHNPTFGLDGKVTFMPWESFTYATKPLLDSSVNVNPQDLQLGCVCSQSNCSPEACDHVYLFSSDYESAKDIDGKLMEGRFPYDEKGRLVLEDGYFVYECNHLCKCSRNCPNRVLQNGVRVKLEVYKTERKGWAVRACEAISRGTFVCEFVGEVLDLHEVKRRRKRYGNEGCDYIFDAGTHIQNMNVLNEEQARYLMDATAFGNVSRFINHSCSPNLVSHLVLIESMDVQLGHIGLYAKQDIAPGEELSFDYQYELQPGDECPCLCGASTCRGRLH